MIGKLSLRGRISGLALVALLMGLGIFSWLGVQSVNDSVKRTLDERLTIARIVANYLDETLMYVRVQVQNAAASPEGLPDEKEFEALSASLRDTLTRSRVRVTGIFLIGPDGKVLRATPYEPGMIGIDMFYYPEVRDALVKGAPTISGLVSGPGMKAPAVLVSSPVLDVGGKSLGVLSASIDVEQSSISAFSQTIRVGRTGYVEIVDGNGIVLARTKPGSPPKVFEMSDHPDRFATLIRQGEATVGTCHRCHEGTGEIEKQQDVLAFAPLSVASWGVAIRQAEEEALSPTEQLKMQFLVLGVILLACTLLLVWATIQGIVKPIRMLTSAARKLADGDFAAALPLERNDEIGQLSTAFDSMRREVARARDELVSRYKAAKHKEELRGQLLSSVISAQEEERKRIARELHDEFGQTLTGLIMSIESLEDLTTPEQTQLKERLAKTKALLGRTLADIRKLTLDLRPSSLDDLGLLAALRAYIQDYPEKAGIKVQFKTSGITGRLDPAVETALFRIVQEATHNAVKHARAGNLEIELAARDGKVLATVEDDGKGFDVDALYQAGIGAHSSGILGIQERTALLGGTFSIKSQPGEGTRLRVEIPMTPPKD
ncbi:MAG: HAMP domain-containing protein [Chloroflexi bacterium]|nr:HAMP domain-containing protein [Chloroflexota bacterium]